MLSMNDAGSRPVDPAPRDWTDSQGLALGVWVALARCYAAVLEKYFA